MNVKKATAVTLLVLFGCGGSGGGGSGQDDFKVCRSYCEFACGKTVLCIDATSADAAVCSSSCVEAFHGEFDADNCGSAAGVVADMSCAELLKFLGLAREARTSTPLDGSSLSDIDRLFSE